MLDVLNTPWIATVLAGISWGTLLGLRRKETRAALFLAALMLIGHAVVAGIVCGRRAPWLSARNGSEAIWQLIALAPVIACFAAGETLKTLDRKTRLCYAGCFLPAAFFGLTRHIPAIRFSLKPEDLLSGRPGVLITLAAGIGIVGTLLILHGREAFRRREGGRYVAALAAAILIPAAVSWVLRGSFRCHIHHYFWALLLLFFFRYDTWFSRCAQAVALGICVDGFVSWGVEPLWYPL